MTLAKKLPSYTKAEARRMEDHLIRRWRGAGKSRNPCIKPFQVAKNNSQVDWDSREAVILNLLSTDTPRARPYLIKYTDGMTPSNVSDTLVRLRSRGLVDRIGINVATKWVLT